jgi:hypothetical protein
MKHHGFCVRCGKGIYTDWQPTDTIAAGAVCNCPHPGHVIESDAQVAALQDRIRELEAALSLEKEAHTKTAFDLMEISCDLRAQLAALRAGDMVPKGWKLVPREATHDMTGAVLTAGENRWPLMETWEKMYDAAPVADGKAQEPHKPHLGCPCSDCEAAWKRHERMSALPCPHCGGAIACEIAKEPVAEVVATSRDFPLTVRWLQHPVEIGLKVGTKLYASPVVAAPQEPTDTRAKALEEAAKICEARMDFCKCAMECAAAIRELESQIRAKNVEWEAIERRMYLAEDQLEDQLAATTVPVVAKEPFDLVQRLLEVEREQREVAYGMDMRPEDTANWTYAETCRLAAEWINTYPPTDTLAKALEEAAELRDLLRCSSKALHDGIVDYRLLDRIDAAIKGETP